MSQVLDARYHSLDEIHTFLDSLDQISEYESFYRVDTIGYSHQENRPILAVKISDNVQVREDEARVLFIGQVHAEEVIGLEAVLDLILDLINPEISNTNHVNILRANMEIWIIPTVNPEGLTAVHEALDVSYRKNKRDLSPEGPYSNGIFDYDPSIGNDIDGVDINRNFDFNWTFGDTFLEPDNSDYAAHYDYYKGETPFSEGEAVAIRDLALREKFLFSIVWHSSRSGNLSEKLYTSWLWAASKVSPDLAYMKSIADDLASELVKEDGSGTYLSRYSASRNGKLHDWFYTETGCIQYLIECGTANLQPDSTLLEDTIDRIMPAMWFLMDRSIGYYMDASQLTGIVSDGVTGMVIEGARIEILEHNGSVLKPRTTDGFGRYRRILDAGTYHVRISAKGYETQTHTVVVNTAAITNQDIGLNPATMRTLNFTIIDEDEMPLVYAGYLSSEFGVDTLTFGEGLNTVELPSASYDLVIPTNGLIIPWKKSFNLDSNLGFTAHFINGNLQLLSASWPWNNGEGPWVAGNVLLRSQAGLRYANGDSSLSEQWMESPLVDLSGKNRIVLEVHQRYETEWDHDPISILILNKEDSVLISQTWTGMRWDDFQIDYMTAIQESGFDSVKVRLSFTPDQSVNYRGWELQAVKLFAVDDAYLGLSESQGGSVPKMPIRINGLYPNPSNGQFQLDVSHWPGGKGHISVYNLLGQEISQINLENVSPGRQFFHLDLEQSSRRLVSSGVYFIVLNINKEIITKKCVLLKQ
jgi:hypothetical protein